MDSTGGGVSGGGGDHGGVSAVVDLDLVWLVLVVDGDAGDRVGTRQVCDAYAAQEGATRLQLLEPSIGDGRRGGPDEDAVVRGVLRISEETIADHHGDPVAVFGVE